jgi:anti-sigma factor RsiW
MICENWRDQLDAFVDGTQSSASAAAGPRLEEHLSSCPLCTAEVIRRIQLKRAIGAAGARYVPSPELRKRVADRVRPGRKHLQMRQWIPGLAAAAAAILICAASLQLWLRHQAGEQAIAQLVDLHVGTIASPNPVDVVSDDRHTVKPWFQGKLPFTFNLPDLDNGPYKLRGGRLVYLDNRPGAQLLFELRKHEFSVFMVQQGDWQALPGSIKVRRNGFSVECWTQNKLRFAIVSDANPSDVRGLADLLKGAAGQ